MQMYTVGSVRRRCAGLNPPRFSAQLLLLMHPPWPTPWHAHKAQPRLGLRRTCMTYPRYLHSSQFAARASREQVAVVACATYRRAVSRRFWESRHFELQYSL